MDRKAVIVKDLNIPLISMVRSLRQKLSKEVQFSSVLSHI